MLAKLVKDFTMSQQSAEPAVQPFRLRHHLSGSDVGCGEGKHADLVLWQFAEGLR